MTPFEFLQLTQNSPKSELRLATVISVNPFRVLFDGDEVDPDEDEIERPRSSSYLPIIGERAVMVKLGRTWTAIDNIGKAGSGALAPPGTLVIRAWRTATQTLTTSVETPINFTGGSYAPWTGHSTATNPSRFTPPWRGWWSLEVNLGWDSASGGSRAIYVQRNGTSAVTGSEARMPGSTSSINHGLYTSGTTIVANLGDYFEVIALQTSGGNLSVSTTTERQPHARLIYRGPNMA